MRVIIAGPRDVFDRALVDLAVKASGFAITEVVSGKASGVDTLGEDWAKDNGVPVKEFPADWDRYKKRAGAIRNVAMAGYADALIAIDTGSPGTNNMIRLMKYLLAPCFILKVAGGKVTGYEVSPPPDQPDAA